MITDIVFQTCTLPFFPQLKDEFFVFVSSLTLKHILLIELEIIFLILLPKLPVRWQNFPKRCIKWRQHYMEIPLIWKQIWFWNTSFLFHASIYRIIVVVKRKIKLYGLNLLSKRNWMIMKAICMLNTSNRFWKL